MPTIPNGYSLAQKGADVLNAIRNSASQDFRNFTQALTDAESIRNFGAVIMQMPALQNEFLSVLWNRIAFALVTSKIYRNHFAWAKKGLINYGETVEEIFVNLVKVEDYPGEDFANEAEALLSRRIPDVRAAFHPLNYKKVYAVTTQKQDLRQAFLSENGVIDLIEKIIQAIYKSAAYDEEQCFKYLLGLHIVNGHLYPVEVNLAGSDEDAESKAAAVQIKALSNKLEFLSDTYNLAGVKTNTPKEDQYLIMNADFEAAQGVRVLAYAFNRNDAEYHGHTAIIDSFGDIDATRIGEIFANDSTYQALTDAQLTALKAIPCVLVDKDFFMIFDNELESSEVWNARKLYMNHFYHTWRTYSISPFMNAIVFVPGAPAVSAVAVTPATATVQKGHSIPLSAAVTTTNFAPKAVKWSITTTGIKEGTYIENGTLYIDATETKTSLTIRAESVFDSTKAGTATITVA